MAAIKPQQAERYLADPPDGVRLFLIYGPDAGAVTERARAVEKVAQMRDSAGGNLIRLGSEDLVADPGRLSDEANAVSMFGGEPILAVRVTDGRHNVMPSITPLLEAPPEAAWIVVEAGDLKPSSPLRKGFEASRAAAAVPCYELDARDVSQMIHLMFQEADLQIEPDAAEALAAGLGADRMASRNEIEKLILYAGRDNPVTLDHVHAAVGENLAFRSDRIIDAALLGRSAGMDDDLTLLRNEGQSASGLATQMLRHLMTMQALRERVDKGSSPRQAVEGARPPIFFKRRDLMIKALSRWPADYLRRARDAAGDAIAASRRQPQLEFELISDALHRIALMSRRLSRDARQ
ncbi:MAG TPA: DNA polymerase III subunit delta [Afifellaceae bacterium]|nr:DNA polymerase III subunit delta [Afifellaceae bacterium]